MNEKKRTLKYKNFKFMENIKGLSLPNTQNPWKKKTLIFDKFHFAEEHPPPQIAHSL